MDLSIIIVSWNSEDVLRTCLRSVYDYAPDTSFEVIVIDNNSADRTVKMVLNDFGQTKLIQNTSNRGFAAAVNQGIAASTGKYVLLLNPDTEFIDSSLDLMIDYMDQYPGIGILGPRILNADGSVQASVRKFPHLSDQFMIMLKLHLLFPNAKSLSRYLARDFNYQYSQEVEQVMGACFMIRREVIEKIGMLDEKYFIWFEEVDYCKQLFDYTDLKSFYFSGASLKHIGGSSFAKVASPQKQKWILRSLRHYFKKNRNYFSWLIISVISPLSLLLSYGVSIFSKTSKGQKRVNQSREKYKKIS